MLSFLGENITCSRRLEMCDWVCACLKVAVTKCKAAVTQRLMWMKVVLDSAKRCGAHTLVCCFRVFGLSSILCSSSLVSDKVRLQPANFFAFYHTLVYPKCYLSVSSVVLCSGSIPKLWPAWLLPLVFVMSVVCLEITERLGLKLN